jgi:ATP synthase protein I
MPTEPKPPDLLAPRVQARAQRKLIARQDGAPGVWSGLGMMGLVGWSVVLPTLLGAALGIWLDSHHAGNRSWTLALLMAGLVLGCLNAWRWVAQQDRAMHAAGRAAGPATQPAAGPVAAPADPIAGRSTGHETER